MRLKPIEEAVRARPARRRTALAWLASHRLSMLQTDAAEEAYRRVLKFDPSHDLANLGLAVVFRADQSDRRTGGARRRGSRNVALATNALNFIRAFDHRRAKRFAEGLAALEQCPKIWKRTRRFHLLGPASRRRRQLRRGFCCLSRMNDLQGADPTRPRGARAALSQQHPRLQRNAVTTEWVGSWRDETEKDERPSPVFLVGFPRSGTTLLDTMLMGHPDIEVLEEEPTLLEGVETILEPFEHLPTASDEQIRERATNISRWRPHAPRSTPGKLLVDKNPLSMNLLPFIRRLFPGRADHPRAAPSRATSCSAASSPTSSSTTACRTSFGSIRPRSCTTSALATSRRRVSCLRLACPHAVVYENVVANQERELQVAVSNSLASSGTTPCSTIRPPPRTAGGSRPPATRRSDNRSTANPRAVGPISASISNPCCPCSSHGSGSSATRSDPMDAPTLEQEAERAVAAGDLQRAAALLTQVAESRPGDPELWMKVAALQRALGQLASCACRAAPRAGDIAARFHHAADEGEPAAAGSAIPKPGRHGAMRWRRSRRAIFRRRSLRSSRRARSITKRGSMRERSG